MTNDDLKRLFDQAWKASEQRSWIAGLLGRINPDGSITVDVPDRPAFCYVRIGTDQTTTIARDANRVPRRANLPVRMRQEGNQLVIYDVDLASGRYEAATAADASTGASGVPFHTHRTSTGLEYEVEALRLEPGRVRWYGGLKVYINPFRYYYGGAWVTWPGGEIDLTPYKPATTGMWRWVVVGVDPTSNTAIARAGPLQSTATALTAAMMDAIVFGGIPAAGVKVREDDTALSDISRYVDARQWITGESATVDQLVVFDDDFVFFDGEPVVWL